MKTFNVFISFMQRSQDPLSMFRFNLLAKEMVSSVRQTRVILSYLSLCIFVYTSLNSLCSHVFISFSLI